MTEYITRFLDDQTRVEHGLRRERQIVDALRDQVGLHIVPATGDEDKDRKIDCWIQNPGQSPVAVQVKYRETGKDLLFEVFDTFYGWNDPRNRIGRDVQGDAKEYAVLLPDTHTIVIVPTTQAKKVIDLMVDGAKRSWTVQGPNGPVFRYFANGERMELKVQKDPRDKRPKMVAYIPSGYFLAEDQAKTYQVNLSNHWK